jgi:hypothetical protein
MTLPRRKSRGLTVDGVRYRWLVTPVSEFTQRLIVEHERGQGQRLVLTRGEVFGTSRVPPITPRYVVVAIRHAQRAGWTPQVPGVDLCVDSSLLGATGRPPRSVTWPPNTTALQSCLDFTPPRARFPWPHHDPGLFVEVRLHADASDKAVGSLFACLAHQRELTPGTSAARLLDALASSEPDEAQDDPEEGSERSFFLEGGIEVIVDGALILRAGCCATIDGWLEWKDLLTTGQRPWNGHDPFTTAALEDGRVRFFDEYDASAPSATVSTERYEHMVEQLERDLRGFLERAEQWLAARASTHTTGQLVEQLATAMKLG